MGILEKIFILFIFTFPTGVLARVQFPSGLAISLNDIVLAILILGWAFYKIKNKKLKKKYFLFKPILIFISLGFFSLLLNFPNLGIYKFLISFSYLARFIGYGFLYFIVADFSKEFKIKINKYLFASGLIVLIIGYIQYFFYPNLNNLFIFGWDKHLYRMVSVFLDPNFAGTFFNIYFIYCLDLLRKSFEKISRFKYFILSFVTILSLLAVYLTYSRSALIMLFVSLITYLILLKKKKYILVSAIILVLLIFLSPRAFQTEGTNLLRIVSTQERIISLQIAVKVIQENPLFGVGFNAYRYAQHKLGLENIYWQITHSGAGTDNSFAFVLATTGIAGFISYIYLLYSMFKSALGKVKKNSYSLVFLSVFLGLILNSFFINSLFYVLILEWIWILAVLTESS